jgi:chromate transporter
MIAGLGLAESTPGPLIMVVQFVGALGAHAHPGGLPPLWAAVAGSIIATWATFMPSYLYIFAGAPVLERWRSHAALGASLAAVSAVVVGVIGNLAVWFALHVVFTAIDRQTWHGLAILVPDPASFQVVPAVLAVACGVALIRFRLGLGWVLGGSILLGGGWHWWSLL